jgi:hypothetical protein
MSSKYERIQEEVVVAYSTCYPNICWEDWEKSRRSQLGWSVSGETSQYRIEVLLLDRTCTVYKLHYLNLSRWATSSGLSAKAATQTTSDYRRVLDWWPNLLHILIQRVPTLYSSLLHTHTLVFTVTSSLPLLGSGFQWLVRQFSHTSAVTVVAGVACLDAVQLRRTALGRWTWRRTSSQRIPWELVCSFALQFSFRVAAASTWSWMRFLSFY